MRVLAAVVVGLAVVAASLAENQDKKTQDTYEYNEAIAQASVDQKKAIAKLVAEVMARKEREREENERGTSEKEEKRDGTVIKWHSMSEVRRLQHEGRKLVIARIDPNDVAGLERHLEVVANELRAKGAEEAIWVKRSVPADDDVIWLGWEGVPITTELFLLTGDPKQAAQLYKGSATFTDLLTWLLQYLPPLRPREIGSEQEMDEFMLASPVSVIAYVPRELGEDGSVLALVKKIARRHPYLPVGLVYPAEELPYTKHTLGPISIYYRDEDHIFPLDEDRLREMDDFTRDNALKKASHQFISRFPDDAAHIFAQGIDKVVFVFAAVGARRRGQTPSYLRELALEMRQRVVIAYVDALDERMDGVREMFGVESAQTVRGFDARTERQYWPARATSDHPLLPYEVEAFVRDLAANKLTPHCKVERIEPADNEGAAVLRLNTRTFEETVLDPTVDAVVCFFATWCPHSRKFLEKFVKAAEESSGKRKVIFGVVDAEKNDVETKNKIRLFPTVILFRKDTNQEVVFSGRRSIPELMRWLDEEMVKEPKEEAPVQEEDVTARDYESPLKKKIKHDFEQQYTLDGLSPFKAKRDRRTEKRRSRVSEVAMAEQETMMAERVLTKLKVDRPTIAEGLERAWKAAQEWQREEEEESTVDEEKDTVEEKEIKKDTVVEKEKKKDAVPEKSTVAEKEIKKETVAEKEIKKDTVADVKKDTVVDKKSTVAEKEIKKDTVEDKKDTVAEKEIKKETVEDKKDTVADVKKDTLAEKEIKKDSVVEKKDTEPERSTVVDETITVTEKKSTIAEKVKDTVDKKDTVPEKEQPPKEKAPEPASTKDTVVETVEKPKTTVVDLKEKDITVDEEAPKKQTVEKQPPVKSEL